MKTKIEVDREEMVGDQRGLGGWAAVAAAPSWRGLAADSEPSLAEMLTLHYLLEEYRQKFTSSCHLFSWEHCFFSGYGQSFMLCRIGELLGCPGSNERTAPRSSAVLCKFVWNNISVTMMFLHSQPDATNTPTKRDSHNNEQNKQ